MRKLRTARNHQRQARRLTRVGFRGILSKVPDIWQVFPMSSVFEIQQAIAQLTRKQFVELERWFDEERNRRWDEEIESDSRSGALDFLLRDDRQVKKSG